jgi:amidase
MKPEAHDAPAPRDGGWFVPHDIAAPIPGAASGPLAALTAAVKDAFDIAGSRTGAGSPEWLAHQQPAAAHAHAVAAVLGAGATVVGKTVCDEFFYSLSGENAHYGTPVNSRAAGRVPGGSSSGSAAAVAAGVCDLALGTDTGGSVRVPAAFCGLWGLRPTHGRVALAGCMPMAPSFDTVGWFASGPGVLRAVGEVMLAGGLRVHTAPARLLVAEDAFETADDTAVAVCLGVLDAAAASLPPRRSERLAPSGLDVWRETFRVIQAWEVWQNYGAFVQSVAPALGPGIAERMAVAATVDADAVSAAHETAARAHAHLRELVEPGTIVALPTAPSIAPTSEVAASDSFRARCLRLTCIAGLGGLPQVNVPAGISDGCPVGLSLLGWAGGDEALLDAAVALAPHCGVVDAPA